MKRKYEVVYIFDSALEEPVINEHLDRFHNLLKSPEQPEPITGMAHWGKRTLAYPIRRKEVGYYVVAHVETETTLLSEFERAIKLDESVLRYLVVINEGLPAARIDHFDSDSPTAAIDGASADDDDEIPVVRTPKRFAAEALEDDVEVEEEGE
jgi:small subunit ribosomal protein S6